MIRFQGLPSYHGHTAHVVGSGPSAEEFFKHDLSHAIGAGRGLVIACNDMAWKIAENRGPYRSGEVGRVQVTADYPYAKQNSPPPGWLGLWVRLGEQPFPHYSNFHLWAPCATGADHWGKPSDHSTLGQWSATEVRKSLYVGGGSGNAALHLAIHAKPSMINVYGLDGGGDYEKFRPCLEELVQIARYVGITVNDAAGRL